MAEYFNPDYANVVREFEYSPVAGPDSPLRSNFLPYRDNTLFYPSQTISSLWLYTDGTEALKALKVDLSTRGHVAPGTNDNLQEEHVYHGLENYLRIDHPDLPPTYVFDQHSLALVALAEAVHETRLTPPAHFLNIDTHSDAREASLNLSFLAQSEGAQRRLKPNTTNFAQQIGADLALEVYKKTAIDQFISHALHLGIIQPPAYWLAPDFQPTRDQAMERPSQIPHKPGAFLKETIDDFGVSRVVEYTIPPLQEIGWEAGIIKSLLNGKIPPHQFALSIDIDYFANMHNPKHIEAEMKLMRQLIKNAGVVIIATSPGYIDQERAIQLTRQLLEPLYQEVH